MTLELTYIRISNDAVFNYFATSIAEIEKVYMALRGTELFYGFTLTQHNADGSRIINSLVA